MNKWPITSLKGKINIKHGFPFKSEYFSDEATQFIVLTPGNFYEEGGFKRQAGKEKFYTGDIPEEYLHKAGDLIVAMTEQAAGLLGSCARVPESGIYLHNQRLGLVTTDSKKILRDYIYHLFKTKTVREQIRLTSSGSKVKHTSPERIYDVRVPLPTVSEQQNIVALLDALETKIELNNRINAELEAMAKNLYDYWFVQFDFPDDSPQGQGKPYKSSGGKMVYNPTLKREIPEGWCDSTLGEITELYQPKTISEKEMTKEGQYLVYGANGIVGRYHQYNHEQSVVAVTCRGNSCGEINVTRAYSWITGNAMVVKSKSSSMPATYIYNLLRSSGLDNVITGSAQPQITRTNLAPMKIIRPDENVQNKYAEFVKPNFEKRMAILDENELLEKLRDLLLPMLMNGQVTVK